MYLQIVHWSWKIWPSVRNGEFFFVLKPLAIDIKSCSEHFKFIPAYLVLVTLNLLFHFRQRSRSMVWEKVTCSLKLSLPLAGSKMRCATKLLNISIHVVIICPNTTNPFLNAKSPESRTPPLAHIPSTRRRVGFTESFQETRVPR